LHVIKRNVVAAHKALQTDIAAERKIISNFFKPSQLFEKAF